MWMSTLHTSWIVALHKNKYCWYKSSFKVTHFILLWIFSNLLLIVLSHVTYFCFFSSNLTDKFYNLHKELLCLFSLGGCIYDKHFFSKWKDVFLDIKSSINKCTVLPVGFAVYVYFKMTYLHIFLLNTNFRGRETSICCSTYLCLH